MKENDGLAGIWTYNDVPEKDEFVLIVNGPDLDNATEIGREKDKDKLIEKAEVLCDESLSSLRIYNDKKLIVWDAFLPTTMPPKKEKYDPEYLREITTWKNTSWYFGSFFMQKKHYHKNQKHSIMLYALCFKPIHRPSFLQDIF